MHAIEKYVKSTASHSDSNIGVLLYLGRTFRESESDGDKQTGR